MAGVGCGPSFVRASGAAAAPGALQTLRRSILSTADEGASRRYDAAGQFMSHRILVVDDDPHIREVICFALEKADMTALTAKDGAEALERLDGEGADLVILDIGMPEMD